MSLLSKQVTLSRDDVKRMIERLAPGLMAELRGSGGESAAPGLASPNRAGADQALATGYFDFSVARTQSTPGTINANSRLRYGDRRMAEMLEADLGMRLAADASNLDGQRKYIRNHLPRANSRELRHYVDRTVAPGVGSFVRPGAKYVQHRYIRNGRPLYVTDSAGRVRQARGELIDWVTGSPPVVDRGRVDHLLRRFSRHDNVNPLGSDMTVLTICWQNLAPHQNRNTTMDDTLASWFRPAMPGTPYPSSVVGTHLMNEILREAKGCTMPPRGDAGWVDWALLFMLAITAAQPFPNFNKRVARFAYALIVHSAGLPYPELPDRALAGKLSKQAMTAGEASLPAR